MKRIVLFILLCGLPLLEFAQDSLDRVDYCLFQSMYYSHADTLCNENPWILVFEDDFTGHGLDKSVWFDSLTNGAHLRPGIEQQYYTFGGNYQVTNSKLYLITEILDSTLYAIADPNHGEHDYLSDSIKNGRNFRYTSSNIETIRKFNFGRFEASVKLPKGKGFWPAFWLLSTSPRYNELDIFEFWNEKDIWGNYDSDKLSKVHHMTSHFESVWQQCSMEDNYGIDFSTDYNVFGVDWDQDKIAWYVNGVQKLKRDKLRGRRCIVEANQSYGTHITHPEDPMRMILNLAIRGNDRIPAESPDSNTPFPSKMRVDWVKVWYRMRMDEVDIASPTQCVLHDVLFNAVTGINVTMGCDYVVPRGQQLSLSASNSVILKSGFVAEAGSVFNARSKQIVYDDRSDNDEDDEDNAESFIDDSDDIRIVSDDISTDGFHLSANGSYSTSNGLYVYPNPTNGVFRVQLPSLVLGQCSVSITELNGHRVFNAEAAAAENISIDISALPQGVYLLHVVGLDSEYNNIQKIVLL
jgi:beta-glucanase (GH16 family)